MVDVKLTLAFPRILIFLLGLLCVSWWSLAAPFRGSTVGDHLGSWIAARGWDSGPPDEYAYDFVLFWHLSFSCLGYWLIALRSSHRTAAGEPSAFTTPKSLVLYPFLCVFIICIFPWGTADISAHKVFSVMSYIPIFCSLALLGSICSSKALSFVVFSLLVFACALISLLLPWSGGSIFMACLLAIEALILIATLIASVIRRRSVSAVPHST